MLKLSCYTFECVCVIVMCVLAGWPLRTCPARQLSAPAGGLEEHQEGKLCAAGGLKYVQASWELGLPEHPRLPPYPPSRPDISLLRCCPLSDASIKQESASGICTHLNRQSGLEEGWLRCTLFNPRLYFALCIVTKKVISVIWGENEIAKKMFFSKMYYMLYVA